VLRGERRDAGLEHQARLEHLGGRQAVQRGEQAERLGPEVGRPVRDEGAGAAARDHDAHRLERLEPRAHARAAQAQLQSQVALAGQPVAGPQLALLDQPPHVVDDAVARTGRVGQRERPARAHASPTPRSGAAR
jgi:hypothetical protein